MNFRAVWGLLGKVLLLLGAMMTLPVLVGFAYGEHRAALG